ncbi:hypothetical protein GCM10012288_19360 [Malaciobacter pacificus]|jgi:cytochrome b|uniref:Cytochrome b n=1 Tax=Malaciobacter pacificus TaxID=1080223 RepID=A0A5C2HA04_9BACT|nr:cytochrome b/b6 domain-containing protein [Malaciobacter pacificus]QEP35653.1 cytochrome b [Malaciobacter pacificus]GGD45149.1 hypothetical protein GCM10012288_19360 [Malaciobacter pacificus]
MNKSYIWTLPTRVFHAFFAIFILFAFLSDEDNLLQYHAIIGYAIFILLFFRVIWGFIGPSHSKFKEFPLGKKNLKEFSKEIFSDKSKYIGHNPAASYVMIAILITVFLTIISGILAYGIQEGRGIASFLNATYFKDMELFEEIHEFFTGILLALIAAHLGGVLVDKLLHGKNKTLNSIANGYKMTEEKVEVKLNIYQKAFATIMLIIFISFLIFNISSPKNILTASVFKSVDYSVQNELFVNECASCHTLYPSKFIA